MQKNRPSAKQTMQRIPHQNWQILIKVATSKNRRTRRYGFAFEATTMDRVTIFRSAANSGRQSIYMATQEAMVEAIFKDKDLGLGRILILSNHKKLVQICLFSSKPSWQDQALLPTFVS
uniref:Reverse transcriptase RNase H-like domain-containing protein n=1 Tax=Quercus lobata TaxID=97700 RepID=A0A7N2LJY3_QUELO